MRNNEDRRRCRRKRRLLLISHHGQPSDLSDSQVESAEVQRLLADSREVWDGRPPLLHERQVAVHPWAPLRLRAHLIQQSYLLVGHGGHAGLLERPRHGDHSQFEFIDQNTREDGTL